MVDAEQLKGLSAEQLHAVTLRLVDGFAEQQRLLEAKDRSIEMLTREVTFKSTKVDQLTHELAQYKRLRFGKSSEKLDAAQSSLLEETFDADLAAIEEALKQLHPPPKTEDKQQPRRTPLAAHLPRVDVVHEPESITCACGCALKRIGEDVAEKLDYVPGVFTVERHVRGKWACAKCQTLIQAPVPAQVIDKGIPTAGLLAQVMVAKYADHLPLYRQETIFERAGLALPRSTLGACSAPAVCASAAAGRCAQGRRPCAPRTACRRDAGGDAQAWNRQDASCLPVGLRTRRLRGYEGGGL
jgi:transposase